MIKAHKFNVTTNYMDVIAEAESVAKYKDMSILQKLHEYRNYCVTLYNNKSRSDIEKHIIATKSFKAKELIDINTIRRN